MHHLTTFAIVTLDVSLLQSGLRRTYRTGYTAGTQYVNMKTYRHVHRDGIKGLLAGTRAACTRSDVALLMVHLQVVCICGTYASLACDMPLYHDTTPHNSATGIWQAQHESWPPMSLQCSLCCECQ